MLTIYARCDGVDLTEYAESLVVATEERDRDNEYRIELFAENGDYYFVHIPLNKFDEFVRLCQKLKAKGIFNPAPKAHETDHERNAVLKGEI